MYLYIFLQIKHSTQDADVSAFPYPALPLSSLPRGTAATNTAFLNSAW